MTALEFYRNHDIAHPELSPQMTEEQYANQLRFNIVTLHQRSNVHYTYSTGESSTASTVKKVQAMPSGLYSY